MTRIHFGRFGSTGGSVAVHTPDGVRPLAVPAPRGLAVTFAADVS